MNRALADLKVWYERVASADPLELERELVRLRVAEANRKTARAKSWAGAVKKQIYRFGLRRAPEDVTAHWLNILQSLPKSAL